MMTARYDDCFAHIVESNMQTKGAQTMTTIPSRIQNAINILNDMNLSDDELQWFANVYKSAKTPAHKTMHVAALHIMTQRAIAVYREIYETDVK